MSKSTSKATPKKLALNKKTVSVLTDKSIIANLKNTRRPIVIISMGCATDFTRQLPTAYQKLLMTDIT
jgi:3-dehydroquinate dehydratase